MTRAMRVALVVLASCSRVAAPPVPAVRPVAIGETFALDSRVLGERRTINVYLPPDYATSAARYPVLYEVDGGIREDFPLITGLVDVSIKNGVIRPIIVVGIENTERRRDLPGPTDVPDEIKAAPHAGGADHYRAFLRDELKPYIAAHYRTTAESAIVGESLAGLFNRRDARRGARSVRQLHRGRSRRVLEPSGGGAPRRHEARGVVAIGQARLSHHGRPARDASRRARADGRVRRASSRGPRDPLRADARRAPRHDLSDLGAARPALAVRGI
jgi:hypothetical protein